MAHAPIPLAPVAPAVPSAPAAPVAAEVTKPPVLAPAPPPESINPAPAAITPAKTDIAERTVWPVAVANQFDSTAATLRLAEITAQTAELSEFISASRQMPAFKDPEPPPVAAPVSANTRAAITLTMDVLPVAPPRKIPMAPLLLLGGLGSTVIILLAAVLLTL